MGRFAYSSLVLVSLTVVSPASAQSPDGGAPPASIRVDAAPRAPAEPRVHEKRPAALVPLYGAFVVTQALDYASTTRAISSGAGREWNPVMEPMVGHPAAFLAFKAASTAGTIWAGEKIWRKNRVGAVVFMVATNSALAVVVAHNYRVAAHGPMR